MATKVAENPGADGVLEPFEELGAEAGGFVEVQGGSIGFGVCVPKVRVGALKQTIHHAEVEVVMGIEGRAETMQVRISKCKIPLVLTTDRYTPWWVEHRYRRTRKEMAAARRERGDA
jgi:hypothetical protein